MEKTSIAQEGKSLLPVGRENWPILNCFKLLAISLSFWRSSGVAWGCLWRFGY